MKRNLSVIGVSFFLLALSSCSHRLVDFTVISTKNMPLGDQIHALQKADQRVQGVDKAHMVLWFPIGTVNMKEAIDRTIEKYPGAVGLADGVVTQKSWWAILYGQNRLIVEGTPIYVSEIDAANTPNLGGEQQSETMLFFHEVKEGESLSSIAVSYNVSVADIIRWNGLSHDNVPKGTKLKILLK